MTPSVVDPAKARPGDLIGYRKDGRPIRLQAGGHTNPFRSQYNFRGRDDGFGLNTTSGWKALSGVDWSQDVDTTFRVRIGIQETAAAAIIASAQLFYSLNGGTWTAITTTSAVVKGVASAQFNEGDAVTSTQLTGGVGPFINGSASEDGAATDLQLLSQRTEWEYALQIVGADVANNDIIGLRVTAEDYGVSDTNIPSITVVKAGGTTHPLSATGTGTSTGSANLTITTGAITHALSSTGIGTSAGIAPLRSTLVMASTGTGISAGTAPLTGTLALASTGIGTSTGLADLTVVPAGPTTYDLSAIGTGTSDGSATLRAINTLASTGTGASTGTAALTERLALASTGTGTSTGTANLTIVPTGPTTWNLSATGVGTTDGLAALAERMALAALGIGTSTGTAALTIVGPAGPTSAGSATSRTEPTATGTTSATPVATGTISATPTGTSHV